MLKIICHVIPAEWQHSHRVITDFALFSDLRRSTFRGHGCTQINPMLPIKRLINQRYQLGSAPSENNCRNGNALSEMFCSFWSRRASFEGSRKPAVGMSRQDFFTLAISHAREPCLSFPIHSSFLRRFAAASFPPNCFIRL